MGIVWEHPVLPWDGYYKALLKYYQEYGNTRVQESYKNADGVKLGHWVSQQRCENSKGTLSNERLEKLNRVNFVWDVKADRWKKNCEKIKEYYWEFGTLKIPTTLENEYGENVYQWF